VTGVDNAGNSATVDWTLPAATGDHELVIVLGNAFHHFSGMDRVTVQ